MQRIGPLSAIDVPAEHAEQTIILFHGYGADAYDLQTLSDVFKPKVSSHYIFPQGHLEVPIGPGWTGRAWWNVNLMALQTALAQGQQPDLTRIPEGLELARSKAMQMIESLKVPWSQIILGGFSQGAMLSTDLYLHAPETPRGLIVMSGSLIAKDVWQPLLAKRSGQRIFMSHGRQDPVLPYRGASQLESFFIQGGLKGSLFSFDGTHEIPPVVVDRINSYLASL